MNKRLSMDNSYTMIPEFFCCKILTDLISFLYCGMNVILWTYIATAQVGLMSCNLYILYIYSVYICIPFHCLLAVTSVSTRISHCLYVETIQTCIDAESCMPWLLLLWLVSEACQTSMSARVAFKWLYIPLASRQPAVMIHHTTG